MDLFKRKAKWTILLEWAPARYDNPSEFANELLQYGVSSIDMNGAEQPMTMDSMMAVGDFEMVVVRSHPISEGEK